MTLSDFSIKRPVFAWILMFGLIFFGALSFTKMGINENPDVEFPVITVRYAYDGATPAVIEKDVLEIAESVLVGMQGIRNITSTADRGSGRITLEFELDIDINFALQEANTLLGRAQRLLPDILEPPVVTKSNADDRPIMYMAMSTKTLSQRDLMILFRDRVQDRLATVEGIAEVRAFGYHEPSLRIDLDADKLALYQLTANDIIDSIHREHEELPAGKFEFEDSEELIRIMGEASEVEDFQNMVISRRGGSPNFVPIRLKDVANIYEGIENIRRLSRVNGIPALGMAIHKQRGVNAVATVDRLKERIVKLNTELPEGTVLSINFDATQFIRESVNELMFTLLLSALLTSIVCWLFIGSWSANLNIILSIPTAIIGTFIFIRFLGFTLNTFSLLGLALAIGVVVDDAVVMLENIIRYVQNGYDRVNAAFKGAREITFVVIATTVALISIFLPIAFMKGIEGRFFFEFAVTISIAVALSSLEALTLAPMRCSQFLKLEERTSALGKFLERTIDRIHVIYRDLLELALHHRKFTVAGSALLFLLSLISFRFISTEFAPPQDRGVLFILFLAPDGKSLEYTSRKVAQFEEIVKKHPAVLRTFVAVGGFGRGGQGNRGNGVIILKHRDEREQNQFEVASDIREQVKEIAGMRIFVRDRTGGALGGRRGNPVEFVISGPDPEVQKQLFYKFKEKMDADPDFVGTRSDDVRTLPEVHIIPNRDKAVASGVEVAEIASVINATFGGTVVDQYTKGGRRFDILVQLDQKFRHKISDLDPILVRNNRGELVPLVSVVDIKKTKGPQVIYREDRIRGVRVDASLKKGAKLGDKISLIQQWKDEILPEHYFIRFSSTPKDKLLDAVLIMLMGLIIAYMALASQFNSFLDPLIVFFSYSIWHYGIYLCPADWWLYAKYLQHNWHITHHGYCKKEFYFVS